MNEKIAVNVGDPIWYFDVNCRVYRKDANGRSMGGPIWAEHWREYAIIGQTSRSWIVGTESGCIFGKIPKNKHCSWRGYARSKEEIQQKAYIEENRYAISEKLRSIDDYAVLRQIATLIGYECGDSKSLMVRLTL